ncbi:MAG TPA: diguanylate cyclase [Thermodesulfobacteriota bacterium]|nr:diguanylate cyclase [Thermodesulfobacteriota bacterium]
MEKKQGKTGFDFLGDLFEYSIKNSFIDTIRYLGTNSRRLISNLSLFVAVNIDTKECYVFAHRRIKKGYLSSVLKGIEEFALNSSPDLNLSEFKIEIQPKEEFIDTEGPSEPNFILTVPVFAGGKSRAFLNFSKSGVLNPEGNDPSYMSLIVDFLSALWEREAREIEEKRKIEELAFIDSLTGVFNRRAFYKLVSQDVSEARRNGTAISLAVFDIDGFKEINDSYGHSFGDMILKQVTSQFRKLLREEDKIFRLGGDEFALLMKADRREASLAIRRIAKEISNSRKVRITLSGGIVEIDPYKDSGVDEIMRRADKILYIAKESGKNRILLQDYEGEETEYGESLPYGMIGRLIEDIGVKLKEFAAEQLASFYLSNGEDKSLFEKTAIVSNYAASLGRELNLPENRIQNLRLGAILYDIGMIAVPRSIRLKGTPLTPDEYEFIKRHTIIGGRMVQRFSVLREVLPIVLYHHEWINGKGYPFGLSGDYIPIEARIVAVADAFQAMQSNRPYRSALSMEESVSEMINGMGIKYDSQVVEALLTLIDKKTTTL